MLIAIILGLVVIIAGVLITSRFQPENYTVQRTGTIAAPPSVVFAQVTNFRNWGKFDPCLELDANTVFSYEGPESGPGAKYLGKPCHVCLQAGTGRQRNQPHVEHDWGT